MAKKGKSVPQERIPAATSVPKEDPPAEKEDELESRPLASARNMPRPAAALPSPPSRDVAGITLSLLGDPSLAPSIEEIDKVNGAGESSVRTPLMTVVHALLARQGGKMSVRDLAEGVKKHWNRPFPSTPYTAEEFLYLMAVRADSLRIEE